MELLNPWVLVALPIVLVGLYLAWRDNALPALRSRLTLLCRAAMCTLLILALADVTLQQPVSRQAVVFVADTSASTSAAHASTDQFITGAIGAKRPDDAYAVVATARDAVVQRVLGTSGAFGGVNTN